MEAQLRPLDWSCLATIPLGDPSFAFTVGLGDLGEYVKVQVSMTPLSSNPTLERYRPW